MNIIYFIEFHRNKLSLLRVVVHKLCTLLPFGAVNEKTIFVRFNRGFFFLQWHRIMLTLYELSVHRVTIKKNHSVVFTLK